METQQPLSQIIPTPVWRDAEHICAISDEERHLGYAVLTDSWHAYDATKLNEAANGFRYLGNFKTAAEAKLAVDRSIVTRGNSAVKRIETPEPEKNKEICRRLCEEAFGKGNLNVVDATVSANCLNHDPAFPSLQAGAEGLKSHIQAIRHAFPDLSTNCDDIIAERDEVVIHWSSKGTHTGRFLNYGPTDRPVTLSGTSIQRLSNGMIEETWLDWNLQSLIDQIGSGTSRTEANKELVSRFLNEIWNLKKPDMIEHFVTGDYMRHSPSGFLKGPDGLRQDYDTYVAAFPDCRIQIDEITCEGDTVVVRLSFSGTQTGELMDAPASGRTVTTTGIAFYRIVNGKIAEEHVVWDRLGMMQQIATAVAELACASTTN